MNAAEVGRVFTPVAWAEWLIERWGIFDAWLDGASVCDPTAGGGAFAIALFNIALARGIRITPELLSRINLIEICSAHLQAFTRAARREYGIEFPQSQLFVTDVITAPPNIEHDILFGNPPWSNFTDLPAPYRERLKPYFVAEGLVPDKRRALLGSSRTDIAALVLKVALGRLLRRNGMGCFYLPLSLFSGDDAHRGFRNYIANRRRFAVDAVHEFTSTTVFDGVCTAYCCAKFRMDTPQQFPVRYFRERAGEWIEHAALPLEAPTDQWRVIENGAETDIDPTIEVDLSPGQKPRQGVNTCGATAIFIFEEKPVYLPDHFIYPLATKAIWRRRDMVPQRWILLPYDRGTGRALSWFDIERHSDLRDYLIEAHRILAARRGVLIRSAINRGVWWSLLGVGPYSFAPYKVIWEAYGTSHFQPVILSDVDGQMWQANQSMQAFIPCWDEEDATGICDALRNPSISALLEQLNGAGRCNWAQPGKIGKILSLGKPHAANQRLLPLLG